jgi:poly-gamma-glutamate synthesis protein (capsule biosynthesis protein)
MSSAIKLLFTGDVFIRNEPGNMLSGKLQELFSGHDIKSCNFEAPVESGGLKQIPKAGSYLLQPEHALKALKNAGFNFFSLANNHIYDYGDEGLKNTINNLEDAPFAGAGMDFNTAYQLKKITLQDTAIGFLSFCESEFGALTSNDPARGGYAWVNHHSVNERISTAKNECDVLILQVHAGVEEIEIPLPEWRQRYHELINLGADIVIGHHPHVPQGWEKYNDKFIFYSLGNFYFDMESGHKYWNDSFIVSVEVTGKKISSVNPLPVKRTGNIVEINEDKAFLQYADYLCGLLNSPEYIKLSDDIAVDLWNTRYKKYYTSAMNGLSGSDSILKIIKVLGRKIFPGKSQKKNMLLLLHNIRIESHRWAVQRALSVLAES